MTIEATWIDTATGHKTVTRHLTEEDLIKAQKHLQKERIELLSREEVA